MAKALIICAAGMSSSLMAKKTTEFLKSKGHDIEVDAISATEGGKAIAAAEFDLISLALKQKCISSNLRMLEQKSANLLYKFLRKPTFLFQWELKKWQTSSWKRFKFSAQKG